MYINFCIYLFLYLFDSKRLDAFPMDIYKNNKGNSYNYRISNKEPDLNSLLQENLVESSLKDTINITDQAKKNNNNNHIPQYMLNLYNVASKEQDSFTEDLFNHGNIVRSYFSKDSKINPNHNLYRFNVPKEEFEEEEIIKAEFRIYRLPNKNFRRSFFQMNIKNGKDGRTVSTEIISSKKGWLSFPITNLVKQWLKKGVLNQELDVQLHSLYGEKMMHFAGTDEINYEPFLVIYSSSNEELTIASLINLEKISSISSNTKTTKNIKERSKRNVITKSYESPCELKPLKVYADHIGLKNFLAPSYLEINQCVGSCKNPGSKSSTKQTNHALLQALYTKVTDSEYSSYPCCAPASFNKQEVLIRHPDGSVKLMKLPKAIVTSCACF